jgi:hypothetical protein
MSLNAIITICVCTLCLQTECNRLLSAVTILKQQPDDSFGIPAGTLASGRLLTLLEVLERRAAQSVAATAAEESGSSWQQGGGTGSSGSGLGSFWLDDEGGDPWQDVRAALMEIGVEVELSAERRGKDGAVGDGEGGGVEDMDQQTAEQLVTLLMELKQQPQRS